MYYLKKSVPIITYKMNFAIPVLQMKKPRSKGLSDLLKTTQL